MSDATKGARRAVEGYPVGRFREWIAKYRYILDPLSLVVMILLVWEGIVRALEISPMILPAPTDVYNTIVTQQRLLIDAALVSLKWILVGFAVGSVVGMFLSLLIYKFDVVEATLRPVMVIAFVVPKIVIAPLLLLWFGATPIYWTLMPFFLVFFPIVENTTAGFNGVDREMLDMSRMYQASEWFRFKNILGPYAVPYIMAGHKIGIRESVIGVIIAEFVAPEQGLGYMIILGEDFSQTAFSFAAILVVAVLGITLYKLFEFAESQIVFWRDEEVVA